MTELTAQRDPERDVLEKLAFDTLLELAKIHGELHPRQDISVFAKAFKLLRDKPAVSGEEGIARLERAQRDGEPGNYLETALVVSCTYLAEAHQELDHDRLGRAWYALAKACYWCGVMRSVNNKIDFTVEAADALRKAESSIGGRNRGQRFAEAKKLVIELVRDFRPEQGWPSRRAAALEIKEHLEDLDPENPARKVVQTSPDRWERTFSDWMGTELKEDEFRYLFPTSKVPKALLMPHHRAGIDRADPRI